MDMNKRICRLQVAQMLKNAFLIRYEKRKKTILNNNQLEGVFLLLMEVMIGLHDSCWLFQL